VAGQQSDTVTAIKAKLGKDLGTVSGAPASHVHAVYDDPAARKSINNLPELGKITHGVEDNIGKRAGAAASSDRENEMSRLRRAKTRLGLILRKRNSKPIYYDAQAGGFERGWRLDSVLRRSNGGPCRAHHRMGDYGPQRSLCLDKN
jgi:hypothetical protein